VGVEEVRTEGETEMGQGVPVNTPPDNSDAKVAREGTDVVEHAGETSMVGGEAVGETSERDAVGEVQGEADEETNKEGDKTKEGKLAKVGEKRGHETQQMGVSMEQLAAEDDAGKEAKKAKVGEGEEAHHEGKKKRGRPAKAKAAKTKPASTEGKKRPVGRPRKATIATAKGEVIMEESGDPAHHTRSKDTVSA
jgi:hypothetical protein